jgi:hypothetical protein
MSDVPIKVQELFTARLRTLGHRVNTFYEYGYHDLIGQCSICLANFAIVPGASNRPGIRHLYSLRELHRPSYPRSLDIWGCRVEEGIITRDIKLHFAPLVCPKFAAFL